MYFVTDPQGKCSPYRSTKPYGGL